MNIVVMGECMLELSPTDTGFYKPSFAGDVYNTAVYLKRILAEQADISILTAIGNEHLSEQMLSTFKQEKLNTTFVSRVADKEIGAYLIQISAEGERSFSYWRDSSAAKVMMSNLADDQQARLIAETDIFYFTGISLAILTPEDREIFWQLLAKLKAAGTRIVFDSNYRAKLWSSKQEAVKQFEYAFTYSDLVFPGMEDFTCLYGINNYQAIADYLKPFNIAEIIIKNGVEPMLSISRAGQSYQAVTKVENVVDTTSAGDSFNAGYIVAKYHGLLSEQAMAYASKLAAVVIQHRGAIIDNEICQQFIKNNN